MPYPTIPVSRALVTTFLVAGAAIITSPVHAQSPLCGDRQVMLDTLAQRNQETPAAIAIDANGSLVEVVVSPSGSWTVLLTEPAGMTCAASSGTAWRALKSEPAPVPEQGS